MRELLVGGSDRPALIDDESYDLAAQHGWSLYVDEDDYREYVRCHLAHGEVRATRTSNQAVRKNCGVRLHTLITGWPRVDHIDHDGLNNQLSNLRPVTLPQNQWNRRANRGCRSRYKGVTWHVQAADKGPSRWTARIAKNGHRRTLGYFETEEEAAQAYDTAAVELFGEYACTNQMLGLLP